MTARSVKFLIFIMIFTAVTAAQLFYFAAFRMPSANDQVVRYGFARLTGISEPAVYCEYKRQAAPDAPFGFDTDLRSAVYGR